MVEMCLDVLNLNYDDNVVEKVVMNNHHHRILPLEDNIRHMQWEAGLGINGGAEGGYDDEYNLLKQLVKGDNDDEHAKQQRLELSHHLAHAYSTATQAPFDNGLVVVMDGMGETYRTMLQARETNDPTYVSDLTFPSSTENGFAFECIPSDLVEKAKITPFDWREAESVYVFEKKDDTIDLRPVFKRFTQENSPPSLYNHGFENMDSVGALYSRASSHIFGDWNACGKVMGLAPWMHHSWKDENDRSLTAKEEKRRIMWGALYSEEDNIKFQHDKDVVAGMPLIARMDSDLFDSQGNIIPKRRYDFDDSDDNSRAAKPSIPNTEPSDNSQEEEQPRLPTRVALEAISLAHRAQTDLEDVLLDFVKHCRETTNQDNLCIAGGVGLNSVLNGRLSRELGFKKTYISPYPGDDGIAVGCCAYGLFGNEILDKIEEKEVRKRPPIWKSPISPYLGPDPSEMEIKKAIEAASLWLDVETIRDENLLVKMAADEIESGGVVAWYQGRSELGPRALGHRSILADPRKKGLVRFINQHVKKRESFRPFAPSVLAEYASEWFELGLNDNDEDDSASRYNVSPYMSLTAMVRKEKQSKIPAVTHVDGSSRLQTVTPEAEPLYHKLITKFYDLTGVPLVLNTSFNTLPGEPIVESPTDAIRSFLCSMGSIEMLVMGDYVVKRKRASLRRLLGESDGSELVVAPTCPKRTGACTFQTTFEADDDVMDEDTIVTNTRVRMPDRPMHNEKEGGGWFDLMDELEGELLSAADGSRTFNEILAYYTATEDDKPSPLSEEREEETQLLIQNMVHRLVRLYERTFISW
jgi:carbamoyltransferase